MPNYKIKRAHLVEGARIKAEANPNKGAEYVLTKVNAAGYDRSTGASRTFPEYDFKLADDSPVRPPHTFGITNASLNWINNYFSLLPAAPTLDSYSLS